MEGIGKTATVTNESLQVAVVDIGNLANLGWVVEGPSAPELGTDIDRVEALAKAMKMGPRAMGFEAPMFVPFRKEAMRLGQGPRKRWRSCIRSLGRGVFAHQGAGDRSVHP